MGVQDVDPLPPQDRQQRTPGGQIARRPPGQADEAHAAVAELGEHLGDGGVRLLLGRPATHAQRPLEALGIEPADDLAREPLATAREADPVNQGDDAQLAPA